MEIRNCQVAYNLSVLVSKASALLLACVLVFFITLPVEASPPLSGSAVNNRAEAAYLPAGFTTAELIYSNTVTADVIPLEALTLTHDQVVNSTSGAQVVLPHVLTNTGNVASSYSFNLVNLGNDGFDLNDLKLIWDKNGNGVFDNGEPVLPLNTPIPDKLNPGVFANLLVIATVPVESVSAFANLQLTATTDVAHLSATNTDKIILAGGAIVPLTKSASQTGYVAPTTKVDYTLTASNIGTSVASPASVAGSAQTPILIDNTPATVFLIRDPIPAHTTYISGSLNTTLTTAGARFLYRSATDPEFHYHYLSNNIPPAQVAEVAVAITTDYMRPGVTSQMTFSVTVDDLGYSGLIPNTGDLYFNDAANPRSTQSNTVILSTGSHLALIGIAKSAGTVTGNTNSQGNFDGSYTVPYKFVVKNYGVVPLYDVQVLDQLQDAKRFGSYVSVAVPTKGQYTIVSGSGSVLQTSTGTVAKFNDAYTGQPDTQSMLAPGASLPVGGEFIVTFSVRFYPSDGLTQIDNTAKALSAHVAGGTLDVTDDSVDGNNPDPDGNGIPSESSPTIIRWNEIQNPSVSLVKTASQNGFVLPNTKIDYTLIAKNSGKGPAGSSAVAGADLTPVYIDNAPAKVFLIRDLIPANTTYVDSSLASPITSQGGKLLYRRASDPPFHYLSFSGTVPVALVAEVAVAAENYYLLPDVSTQMSFSVTVNNSGYAGIISNKGTVYFSNVDKPANTDSNEVSVTTNAVSIGLAKHAGTSTINPNQFNEPDGTYTVPLTFTVKNYSNVPLYDVELDDLLEGSQSFGTYTANTVPAINQYTIVAGSGTLVSADSGVKIAFNNNFTGQNASQNMLAPGGFIPAGAQFAVQFSMRVFPPAGITKINNTAWVRAAMESGGSKNVVDQSTDGFIPDPNQHTVTIVNLQPVQLSVKKLVSVPRRVSRDSYELDYTIKVKNIGEIEATFVRVSDNLDCTYLMDKVDGPVKEWKLMGDPVVKNGLLVSAGSTFTGYVSRDGNGRGVCDRNALGDAEPKRGFPLAKSLDMVNGERSLMPGQEEEITLILSITVNQNTFNPDTDKFINKVYAGSFIDNGVSSASVVVAAADSVSVVFIDPQGIVYDSVSRVPVAGATVIVTREQCVGSAPEFTPSQLTATGYTYTQAGLNKVSMVTGADGEYKFLLGSSAKPSIIDFDCDYSLEVVPPASYIYLSKFLPEAGFVADGTIVQPQAGAPPVGTPLGTPATHYYLKFHLGPNSPLGFTNNHIPLDPSGATGNGELMLSKTASKSVVELVDFLDYTLTLSNQTNTALTGFTINDTLPLGFAYERGSTLINGFRVPDPEGGQGRALKWTDTTTPMATGATVTISYRVRVGVGATLGDATNHAIAMSGRYTSMEALARVQIIGGVFSDEGFIVGKVYTECNGNRIQDHEEIGVPGVRVFLEDGTNAISDVEGKYSFYGIKPVTHVLKVDNTTLPNNAVLMPLSNRNSGMGDSRFVDLKKSELEKADFAIDMTKGTTVANAGCSNNPVMKEVQKRRKAITNTPSKEMEYAMRTRLTPLANAIVASDTRSLPAFGVIGQALSSLTGNQLPGNTGSSIFNNVLPPTVDTIRPLSLPDAPVSRVPVVQLEDLIVKQDNKLGFVDLKDNDTLPSSQTNIRVKGVMGATFKLSVNGVEVAERRVGKRSKLADKQIEAWEYVGIDLSPGKNTVKLQQFDGMGNARGDKTITLIAPDALGKVEIDHPESAVANGSSPIRMKVRLTDNQGVPVTARTQVTLETEHGRWVTEDLNPMEKGTQIFVQGGSGEVVLMPPNQPVDSIIRVSTGILKQEVKMSYLPELRPLTGAGIVEGVIDMRSLAKSSPVIMRPFDAFETDLINASRTSNDGKVRGSGRAAFFFKGAVFDEYLLTAAYDSNKTKNQRLFRDILPDQYYPIYGDSAVKGFDAQSTSREYVRVDKGRSYLLYGDFMTAALSSQGSVRQLTQISRSMTGGKAHYENSRVNVTGFYSRQSTTQVVEEIPANGTSGPYFLNFKGDYVVNSEKVEVLVRDRNLPSLVIASSPQTRFTDYNVDVLTGQILFRGPVPSMDANLNNQYIRVTYEIKPGGTGGPQFGVGGVDAQFKVTDNIQLGLVGYDDKNPMNNVLMGGATGVIKLGDNTFINGEFAHTQTDLKGSGNAERVEIKHNDANLRARAQFSKTGANFSNPSAYSTSGRTEIPAIVEYTITPNLRLKAEGLYSKDDVNGGSRKGVVANIATKLMDGLNAEFGTRLSEDSAAPGGSSCVSNLTSLTGNCMTTASTTLVQSVNNHLLTVRSKFTAQIPWVTGLQSYIEAEQDVRDIHKHLFAVGGSYQLSEKSRVFGRYQFASSLGSQFALNSFAPNNIAQLGIESAYMKGGNMFNEYRIRDGQSGREAQAATGVRNTWQITEGLRVNAGLETTKSFNGLANNNSAALVSSVDYTASPRLRTTAGFEIRKASTQKSLLNTFALTFKISSDWTFLGRNIFSYTDSTTGGTTIQTRQQLGFAYREVERDIWNWLALYEHRYNSVSGLSADSSAVAAGTFSGSGVNVASGYSGNITSDTHIVSVHLNYQVNADVVISGHYAGKLMTTDYAGLRSMYWAQLVYARAIWDFASKWDVGVQTSYYFGRGGTVQYAVGAEIGYQAFNNLWLSIGYNLSGIHDPVLTANQYLDNGVYGRIRYKFDENTFSSLR